MTLVDAIRKMYLGEAKDSPPFDVSKADYAGAAKELTQYAKKSGGIDKNDFLGFANRMSAIAGKKSPRVTSKFARDLQDLDTSPREKIISVMRNNGIKVTMAGNGLKIEDLTIEDLEDLEELDEAVNMDRVQQTYKDIMKGGRRGPPDDDEVGDYIGKGFTKQDIAALIKMLARKGYDAKFLTKDLAPLAEAYKSPGEAQAYEDGKKAVAKKVSYDDNPNKKGTKEYTAWSKGHNDARAKMIANRHTKEEVEEAYRPPTQAEIERDKERDRKARGQSRNTGTYTRSKQYKNYMGGLKKEDSEVEEARDPSKSGGSGYDLYHKDFSSAMKHAYDYAKKKFGIEIDPQEIDDKVASGPRKPSAGKTNSYRLKSKDGKKGVQIQVANLDNKKYELNMYKEEVEMENIEEAEFFKWEVKIGGKSWRGTARNAGEAVKKARPSMGNLDLTKASVTRIKEDVEVEEKKLSLEEAVMLSVFGEAKKDEKKDKKAPETDKDDDGEGMDPVDKKALKKDYDDRAKDGDGDLDNDGDEDKTDKYLHKKRQAVTKAINNKKKGPKSNGKSEPVDTTPTMDEEMSDAQMKKRDEIMKGLEKKKGEFVSKYGDRAKEVMARTATKMAMKESSDAYGKSQQAIADRKKRDAISSSDKDKLGKLAALMAKQKNNK